MSSLISTILSQQSYELVHNRIGQILTTELESQFLLSGDYDLEDIAVYSEREIPVSEGEPTIVNVMQERGEYERQTADQNVGTFRWAIACIAKAKSTNDEYGDARSSAIVKKVLGLCKAILEHDVYRTLAFNPPFIENRHIESVFFGKPVRQDTSHFFQGNMILSVRVGDNKGLSEAVEVSGYDTVVKLELTDKGYLWKLDESFTDKFDYRLDFNL